MSNYPRYDFRLYTPDFDEALEVWKKLEEFEYSPELAPVVNKGYMVRCYARIDHIGSAAFGVGKTAKNLGSGILEIDKLGMK